MRLSFPNLPDLGRVVVAVKNVRWRDPLVQVWGLIGVVLVTGIVSYYGRRNGAGEQKNALWAASLLTAEADNAGWHPAVCFGEPDPMGTQAVVAADSLDLRACANAAAARKNWRFLTPPLRQKLAALKTPVRKVLVTWSGTQGGDARALELYFSSVRDETGGAPGEFVIGNGRRSGDGAIEATARWLAATAEASPEELRICLVGNTGKPTAFQKEALGELISTIEARSGTVELSLREPTAPPLLAHVE